MEINEKNRQQLEQRVHNEKWQMAVFGHMVRNKAFFLKCRTNLNPDWFKLPRFKFMAEKFFELYDKLQSSSIPTKDEFFSKFIDGLMDHKERHEYEKAWLSGQASADNIRITMIEEDMTNWLQVSKMQDLIEEVATLFNKKQITQSLNVFREGVDAISRASFTEDGTIDWNNAAEFIMDAIESRADGIHMGHKELDRLLVDATETIRRKRDIGGGKFIEEIVPAPGLKRGDTTMLVGPANSGKTSFMITLVKNAIAQNKKVLYITHEMSADELIQKLFKALTETNMRSIKNVVNSKDPDQIAKGKKYIQMIVDKHIRGNLTYLPWIKSAGMYVEDVVDKMRMLQEEMISKTGSGYDLIINDYPAKLQSRAYQNKRIEHRLELAFIYNKFVQFGLEHKVHCFLGVQANRDGYKKSKEGKSFLGMDDVGESFGISQIADNVITINRSDEDKASNKVVIYLDKSRSSETGRYFISSTRLDLGIMYSEGVYSSLVLEASSGFGSIGTKETVNNLLKSKEEETKLEEFRALDAIEYDA